MSVRKSDAGKPTNQRDTDVSGGVAGPSPKDAVGVEDECEAEIISNPSTSTILQWIEDYLQCSPEGSASGESETAGWYLASGESAQATGDHYRLNFKRTAGHNSLDFSPAIIPDAEQKKRSRNRVVKKKTTKPKSKRAASASSASDDGSDRAEARSRRRTANRRSKKTKNHRSKRGGKRARRR